jgi:hypothetical protein
MPCPVGVQTTGGGVTSPLVQPADGAVGVPTTIGSVVALSDTGLTGTRIELLAGASATFGDTFIAASSTTVSAVIPTLAAHTTYTVFSVQPFGTQPSAGGCGGEFSPVVFEPSIGSFTTQ